MEFKIGDLIQRKDDGTVGKIRRLVGYQADWVSVTVDGGHSPRYWLVNSCEYVPLNDLVRLIKEVEAT